MKSSLPAPKLAFDINDPSTSDPSLTSFDHVLENIDHPHYFPFKMATLIASLGIQAFSVVPLGCIWHYERYGGDPQKRTILNQLIGLFALNTLTGNLTALSALVIRLAFGPLPVHLAISTFFFPNVLFSTTLLLALNEIIVIRFLSVFWWKRVSPLDDNFFGLFFTVLNYSIALVFTIMGHIDGGPKQYVLFLMSGLFPKESIISNSM